MSLPVKVSVLLPTFNRLAYLGQALASILNQTLNDLEVVVVDDGSTDETAPFVRAIPDSRVVYIYQNNQGVAAALNTAWRAARGEYLAILGSDDIWLPQLLANLVPQLEMDPTLGVVYGRAQCMDAEGSPIPGFLGAPEKYAGQAFKSIMYGDCVSPIAVVMRRILVRTVGGYDETLVGNEDWDLWIRLSELCRFRYIPKVLAYHRVHERNLTGPQSQQYSRLLQDRLRVLDKVYARDPLPTGAEEIKRLAYRNVYLDIGQRHFSNARRGEALKCFILAVRIAPNPVAAFIRGARIVVLDQFLNHSWWGSRVLDSWVAMRNRYSVKSFLSRRAGD